MLFTPLLDIQTVCWHEREQNKTHTKKSWIGYLQKKGPPNASRHRPYNSQHVIISDTQRNIFVSALFRQNLDSGGNKTKRAEHSEPCRVVFKALQLSRKTWIFALTDNAHGETLTTERKPWKEKEPGGEKTWSLLNEKVILPSSCWHLALSKQPWMLYIQGEDTWLSLRLRSRPWADITDMVGCVFMPGMTRAGFRFRTVSDFSVAASRSPLAVRFLSSERMNYKLIKVRFFSIQSPQHNADASSNEVVIMHITDIKRKELKSLHV